MDQEDFTSNEVIDDIQVGDTTIDIVGYVKKVSNNFHSLKKSKFLKFVVSNGNGREVQVIAWNEKTDILKKVKEMGQIVYIGSTKAAKIQDKSYNNGIVNFELQIKDNSVVEIYGIYEKHDDELPEEVSIFEALDKINKKIKVEGIVKSEFHKYQNKDFEFIVGSITDCNHKLEVKFNGNCCNLKFEKGNSVEIVGVMEQYPPGPPVLKVDNVNKICHIDRDRVPFEEVLNGYCNK